MNDSKEKWTCQCGYIGMNANSVRHLKSSLHNKQLLKIIQPTNKVPKQPPLTYLEKQQRGIEIIKCPYCEMSSRRNTLKKHIEIQHGNKTITTNHINRINKMPNLSTTK